MGCLLPRLLCCVLALLMLVSPAQAVLNDDSYDGNIYALYAGNGSLVPPANTLGDTWRSSAPPSSSTFLDDSAVSKRLPLSCRNCSASGAAASICCPSPSTHCRVVSPPALPIRLLLARADSQVVVIDPKGDVVFDQDGQVALVAINEAISQATGLPAPDLPTIDQGQLQRGEHRGHLPLIDLRCRPAGSPLCRC
ncbi:MAG: hypothetical protein CM15mP77_1880 [Synechococcus sp.]|nr:MAG: hypothetical protein CM15mP77_1880 [Synechococcus sp.]